jgi:hypothetical protein
MKTLTKTLLLTGILTLAGFMTSCETASGGPISAVTCDKCKTVWVKRPAPNASGKMAAYTTLRSEKSMDCPDCESAVATFFKTGSLKHSCSHCGGALTHCESH